MLTELFITKSHLLDQIKSFGCFAPTTTIYIGKIKALSFFFYFSLFIGGLSHSLIWRKKPCQLLFMKQTVPVASKKWISRQALFQLYRCWTGEPHYNLNKHFTSKLGWQCLPFFPLRVNGGEKPKVRVNLLCCLEGFLFPTLLSQIRFPNPITCLSQGSGAIPVYPGVVIFSSLLALGIIKTSQ